MYQYVERFRYTGSRHILSFYNRFIRLRTSDDIIRFDRKQFLQDVGSTVGFEGPHLHFPETLTTKLGFTTQRLLGNQDCMVRLNGRASYHQPCGAV
jgi:hypothetical protein